MNKVEIHLDTQDTLTNVVSKLSVIHDFFVVFEDENYSLLKQTLNGLESMMGECINTLKTIGYLPEKIIQPKPPLALGEIALRLYTIRNISSLAAFCPEKNAEAYVLQDVLEHISNMVHSLIEDLEQEN